MDERQAEGPADAERSGGAQDGSFAVASDEGGGEAGADEAAQAYRRARELTENPAERAFLEGRLRELSA